MAFRVVRRWPGSSQMRAVLRPGLLNQQQSRFYADEYTGKALNDKEKAAENRYIKKMEEEHLAKKAAGVEHGATPETPLKPEAPLPTAESGFRNTAVIAAGLAAVALYWLWSGSSKKEEKETIRHKNECHYLRICEAVESFSLHRGMYSNNHLPAGSYYDDLRFFVDNPSTCSKS